jgi:oligo-1,6-glucosidase/alpha-glucosidase
MKRQQQNKPAQPMPATIRILAASLLFFIAGAAAGQHREYTQAPWWQTTSIYQVYPRSYMDSDGDGIGDLAGIISKLDYICDLGFETIWISPFFASPQGDFGYDISDYYSIDPAYGDLATVDSLIGEVHRRGMRIVFDLVLNHTSIEHEWFIASSASRDNDKSDYYIWRDGRGRRPPNNWNNVFNKKSWYFNEARGQYYYTAFLEFQPDLNWRNPQVRAEMFSMARHWLDRGVDGFRLDIFNCIMEDPSFANNPFAFKMLPSRDGMEAKFQRKTRNINHPDNVALARQLRDTVDATPGPDRFLLGEAIGPLEDIHALVGEHGDGLHLIFLFDMIFFDFKADFFRERIEAFEAYFPAPLIPTVVFGNHDNFRRTRRIKNDLAKDRLLTLFQLTVRGVPVVYYGEEIGMLNAEIAKKAAKDPISKVFKGLPQFVRNWLPMPVNRDVCRTPMQWDASANAGFSPEGGESWLPVSGESGSRNVEAMSADPRSLLNTHRDLLHIRSKEKALYAGRLRLLDSGLLPDNVLGYIREDGDSQLVVLLNFASRKRTVSLPGIGRGEVIFGLGPAQRLVNDTIQLDAFDGVILRTR